MTAWVVIPGDENTRESPFETQDGLHKLLILLGAGVVFS